MSANALGMIIFAYLCGSISSAILICRLARLPDQMEWDNKRASQTDDVVHCLDYASVSNAIIDYVESRRFELGSAIREALTKQREVAIIK